MQPSIPTFMPVLDNLAHPGVMFTCLDKTVLEKWYNKTSSLLCLCFTLLPNIGLEKYYAAVEMVRDFRVWNTQQNYLTIDWLCFCDRLTNWPSCLSSYQAKLSIIISGLIDDDVDSRRGWALCHQSFPKNKENLGFTLRTLGLLPIPLSLLKNLLMPWWWWWG